MQLARANPSQSQVHRNRSALLPAQAATAILQLLGVPTERDGSALLSAADAARHLPLAELEARLPEVAKNKALPLVLVCASGMRSSRAVSVARKLGYEKVFSLRGGMNAWKEANLPVSKT